MKVYIAYKFTNIDNKENLKAELEHISNILDEMGHETFILGRDYKKWKHVNISKVLPNIIKKLSQRDVLLAYVNSDVKSQGLAFETIIAKLLGKRRILVVKPGIKPRFFRKNFDEVIEVTNLNDLKGHFQQIGL